MYNKNVILLGGGFLGVTKMELSNCGCQYWEACDRVTSWQTHIPSHFMTMKSASMFFGGCCITVTVQQKGKGNEIQLGLEKKKKEKKGELFVMATVLVGICVSVSDWPPRQLWHRYRQVVSLLWEISLWQGSKTVGCSVCLKVLSGLLYALIQAYKGVRHLEDQDCGLEFVLVVYD